MRSQRWAISRVWETLCRDVYMMVATEIAETGKGGLYG
jgi:hypothetical protein